MDNISITDYTSINNGILIMAPTGTESAGILQRETYGNRIVSPSRSPVDVLADMTLLKVKIEPCQVAEISTSNLHNLQPPKSILTSVQPHFNKTDSIFEKDMRMEFKYSGNESILGMQNKFLDGVCSDSAGIPGDFANPIYGFTNMRPPNSYWQYPITVHESVVPAMGPPITGFQILTHQNPGNCLFVPAATNSIDTFHSNAMWATYSAAHMQNIYTTLQQPVPTSSLLPINLMGTDYLSSTSLRQDTQVRSLMGTNEAKRSGMLDHRIQYHLYNNFAVKIEDRNEIISDFASNNVYQSSRTCKDGVNNNEERLDDFEQSPKKFPISKTTLKNLDLDVRMDSYPLHITQSYKKTLNNSKIFSEIEQKIEEAHREINSNKTEITEISLPPETLKNQDKRSNSGLDLNSLTGNKMSYIKKEIENNLESARNTESGNISNTIISKTSQVDLSGLELLSNISIEAIHCKETSLNTKIVQGKSDKVEEFFPIIEPINLEKRENKLEGLKLLCALAEQRIEEEQECIEAETVCKKQARKLRKLEKAVRKAKIKRRTKKKKKKLHKHEKKNMKDLGLLNDNVAEVLNEIKSNYNNEISKEIQWPTPDQLINAMENDMRKKLADISREFHEKKNELLKLTTQNLEKNQICAENNVSAMDLRKIYSKCKEQNVLEDMNLISENGTSETEEINFQTGLQHKNIPLDYLQNNENNALNNVFKHIPVSCNLYKATFKSSHLPVDAINYSCNLQTTDANINKEKVVVRLQRQSSDLFTTRREKNKHHSKIHDCEKMLKRQSITSCLKNYKDKKHELFNKKISDKDELVKISEANLSDQKTRILTSMGGLFYAGYLQPVQPPDIYSVTLDGERGNKAHIMCTEEVLKDVIREVSPSSTAEVPPGTRICAYWSSQYRCLYPGTTVENLENSEDSHFVNVEFDDGDSGKIVLNEIRFILSNFRSAELINSQESSSSKKKKKAEKDGFVTHISELCVFQQSERCCKHNKRIWECGNIKCLNLVRQQRHDQDDYCKHKKHKKTKKQKRGHKKDVKSEDHMKKLKVSLASRTVKPQSCCVNSLTALALVNSVTVSDTDSLTEVYSDCANFLKGMSKTVDCPISIERRITVNSKSKMAAFLPEKKLWSWHGKGIRRPGTKSRAKKTFFKTIQREKESITVGESAVFLSTSSADRPYIGKIQSMWETSSNNKIVKVRWFYHPAETVGCPSLKYPGALFESAHEDENDVQTISHKCEVISLDSYKKKFGENPLIYDPIYFNNDTYYYAGYYDPTIQIMKLEPTVAYNKY